MSSSRRSSIDSASDESEGINALDSTSHLVLVHDDDEDDNLFDFDEGGDEEMDSQLQLGRSNAQPLSPTLVFLYLLSPYLKLGSMLLPNVGIPLKIGLPSLFLFSLLSGFARQIWFMLSRHIRKDDMLDVVVDVFTRSRRRTMKRRRKVIRGIVLTGTGLLRILLAIVYLRVAVALLVPLLTDDLPTVTPTVLSFIIGFFLFPFCFGRSLASRTVVYSTWLSIAAYILWFISVVYAHSKGVLKVSESWLKMGTLWQGITTIAFTFTTSNTLALYASLKASMQPSSSAQKNPALRIRPFIMFLHAATLITGIPSILATVPKLPTPERFRGRNFIPFSRILTFLAVVLLAFVPVKVSGIFSDILLSCALFATYLLPGMSASILSNRMQLTKMSSALLHIINHFFRRPLSIVMPTNPSTPNPSSAFNLPADDEPQSSIHDPLLQRKEKALQRKQWQRRIIWDLGVWILLLPVGGGGIVWALGTMTGRW
ncbi:hypothetical protein VNI00_014919 [Paramarasmius palmivorus]|uniref:Uncharacterized protein n=1 Tax=Paramarasmius palmivorus TaxID=297713 RepID=A0AAW0BNS5_9AGAR